MNFSFIIPVFNRPNEIRELLESFINLEFDQPFEIVIVEDGSTLESSKVVSQFEDRLNISYFKKENSGPGDSRNYGMREAKGDYYLILDSDCIVPSQYLNIVSQSLKDNYVDCFGGPDAAHPSFSNLQKAINFSMTSVLSTGGVRGGKGANKNFQPRSFNMGLSKEAFLATGGFGRIHPGEDPDLSMRLKKSVFKSRLIKEAYVFHKRRINWSKFYKQVYKFGLVRPILNKWHPEYAKPTFWFPTLFILGLGVAIIMAFIGFPWLLYIYAIYFAAVFFASLISEKNFIIALYSLVAVIIQFFGYGFGYLKSYFFIHLMDRNPEIQFPNLFFKHV